MENKFIMNMLADIETYSPDFFQHAVDQVQAIHDLVLHSEKPIIVTKHENARFTMSMDVESMAQLAQLMKVVINQFGLSPVIKNMALRFSRAIEAKR